MNKLELSSIVAIDGRPTVGYEDYWGQEFQTACLSLGSFVQCPWEENSTTLCWETLSPLAGN